MLYRKNPTKSGERKNVVKLFFLLTYPYNVASIYCIFSLIAQNMAVVKCQEKYEKAFGASERALEAYNKVRKCIFKAKT
jgi:hypothetical protein